MTAAREEKSKAQKDYFSNNHWISNRGWRVLLTNFLVPAIIARQKAVNRALICERYYLQFCWPWFCFYQ